MGAGTGILGALLTLSPAGLYLEKHAGLQWLFTVRGPISPPPEVAVVAINERVADRLELPSHPRNWPRSIHARLIDELTARGVALIVFDMDFKTPRNPEDDSELAQAVARSGRVVLFEALNGKRQPITDIQGNPSGSIWVEELLPPIPELVTAARALGPFPLPKVQVTIFQFWAFKSSVSDVATLPAVALQLSALPLYTQWHDLLKGIASDLAERLPAEPSQISDAKSLQELMRTLRRAFLDDPGLADALRASLNTPTEIAGETRESLEAMINLYQGGDTRYLNFYGPPGTIPNIPYDAVLNGTDPLSGQPLADLSGRVVFVGFSDLYDPGQPDRFYTVYSQDGVDLSGVEIMATAFGNLLNQRSLQAMDGTTAALLLLGFGLLLGSGIYLLPVMVGIPLALALSGGYLTAAQLTFSRVDFWLPLATPLLIQLPVALLAGLLGQYLFQRQRQEQATRMVSYYLPERAVRELNRTNLDPSALNKVVYGVCFATDMSGFTAISQTMEPAELAAFMNAYFDTLAAALHRHKVDVTEFHADTIMCTWTSDEPENLDRRHAPRAALALIEAVQEFNDSRENINLKARVGMDEGRFFLGHTGGGGRLGYSILGDCANTAARLESLNKHLRTKILASAPVVADSEELLLRDLGKFVMVGKAAPATVMEVMAILDTASPELIRLRDDFAEALHRFNYWEWAGAAERFSAILKEHPGDGPSKFYLDRCRHFQRQPPVVEDPTVIEMDAK